ncbi:MAG: dihydroorotate dehydrogenase electron transfer subunit [Pirellulaceae bacterium]|nr:dihydroorotate dehydrogenase electron transfer subunit [Pirellulaceae bacterium]
MDNPLHASCYADQAVQQRVEILENVPLAEQTYRLRFRCPPLAERVLPGQFLMLRIAGLDDPLIGRPLALYDVINDEQGCGQDIDVVYIVKGNLTTRLADCQPGVELDVWGPLGNGFPASPTGRLIMVAGGIGQTPFLALGKFQLGQQAYGRVGDARPLSQRVTLCYGARRAGFMAGLDDFEGAGFDLRLATDDGSRGHHGLVTDLLEEVLAEQPGARSPEDRRIVCCGPERMMCAVAEVARQHGVCCHVSLETPMACGIGICFTCVAKVREANGEWDYKRTCVEGPVFDAERIVWDQPSGGA